MKSENLKSELDIDVVRGNILSRFGVGKRRKRDSLRESNEPRRNIQSTSSSSSWNLFRAMKFVDMLFATLIAFLTHGGDFTTGTRVNSRME